MVLGSSSLLRPSPAPLVRAALLGCLAFASATPPATAASAAPTRARSWASRSLIPIRRGAAPVQAGDGCAHHDRARPRAAACRCEVRQQQRPAATVAPKQARKTPTTRHTPQKAVAVRTTRCPRRSSSRLPDSAIDSPQHVSRTLVLALGLLVLLSASLVAGAARELAR